MYDQSFNEKSLEREIRKSDFTKLKQLRDEAYRTQQLMQACQRAEYGFSRPDSFALSKIRSKTICTITKYSDELVIRKTNSNLIKLANVKSIDRDSIVDSIKSILKEGTEYRIYRLDIKSFYESILPAAAIAKTEEIKQLSSPTKRYIKEIITAYNATGNTGLPRGLSISATLAELLMRDLDEKIRRNPDVYFYSRYVDDIVIITNGNENKRKFINAIKRNLPTGLRLNPNKQTTKERAALHKDKFSQYYINNNSPCIEFEFLGYSFKISDPTRNLKKTPRKVTLDIAESKVKKIKTRIIKSLIDYNKNRDIKLLEKRISFLCTNFSVIDSDRDRKRLAGIHHNYHQVDLDTSKALPELDKFLSKVISSGQGKVCDTFFILTSDTERRRLLRWSFIRGFGEKKYLHFSKKSLTEIQRCWMYA